MSQYDNYFKEASAETGLSVELLKAVAKTESNFDATAVSSAGAIGVMQLMPNTFNSVSTGDITDPHDNILAGATYLSQLVDMAGGDTVKALAMYNAGPGNVSRDGAEAYSNYTNKVLDNLEEMNEESLTKVPTNAETIETKWWGDIVVVALCILVVVAGVVLLGFSFGSIGTIKKPLEELKKAKKGAE